MKKNNININSNMKTKNTIFQNFATRLSLLVIAFIMAGMGQLWGASWTWTAADNENWLFGITDTKRGIVQLNGKKWSFSRGGTNIGNNTSSSTKFIQFGKGSYPENVVLSTRAFNGTITQIDVVCASAGGKHTCKIEVGGTTVKSATKTSSWTSYSTISTGTISNQGEIKITFDKDNNTGAVYINSITVTYTPTTYNVDWYVGDSKEKGETSVATGTPPSVADNALGGDCSSLKFLGWSETNIGSTPNVAPSDLFQPDNLPGLTKNTTYYAVFGDMDYDDADSILIQTHMYDTWTYSGTTNNITSGTYARLFANNAYIVSSPLKLEGLASVIICGGSYGGSGYNGLFVKDEDGNSWKTGTVSTTSRTSPYTLCKGVSLTGKKALHIGSSSGDGTSNGVCLTSVRIFSYIPEYSNCVTTCGSCTDLDAPENLVESNVTPTSVQLSWDAVSNASSYKVTIEGTEYEKVVNDITTTSVTIDDLSAGCSAYYLWTVKAIGDGADYCDSDESETGDFTTPTLSSIALSGTYPTSFIVGDAFSHGSQVVTATYSNSATKVVTGSCSWTGYNMSSAGDQTVTVSYTECATDVTQTYGIHLAQYTDYRFSCAELTLTPKLVTAGTPIFITSTASKTVRSQDSILIVGNGLTPSTALTFPELPSKFVIKSRTGGTLQTDASGEINAVAYIYYTPAADASTDGLDKLTGITVSVGGAKPKQVSLTQEIIGRHLPTDFVIAVKKNGKWYALPDTMTSTRNPEPIEIAVDNYDNPSIAYTASTNIFNLYGQVSETIGGQAGYLYSNGETVKFGMKSNTTYANYPLFGSATGTTTVGKGGSATSVTNNIGSQYWWTLKQFATEITNPQDAKYYLRSSNNAKALRIKDNPAQWGLYASGDSIVRIIPASASSVVFAEASVVAWGKNSAIIEVNAGAVSATKVVGKLPDDIESSKISLSETRTSVKKTGTRYNYTVNFGEGVDFSANEGKMLTLEWYNSSDVLVAVSNVMVPRIVAVNTTINKANYGTTSVWNTEVHVLPGDTLFIDASAYDKPNVTINELHIYPNATVQVLKDTLVVKNLILRNGWNRLTAETEYDVARLYIKSGSGNGTLKATNAYADWYIDYDQYYPIAVPWKAATSSISYRNTSGAASAGLTIRHYDGERHAKGGKDGDGNTNWKKYTWGDDMPEYLVPGIGYAMTARRPAGKAFSIVRMPLTIPSAAWTTLGEQGEVSSVHKDQVSVTAWVRDEGETPDHAKGWNFIANPYMSIYEGAITHSVGEDYNIEYVNIPDVNFKEFEQVTTETAKLKPGGGVLIQTKETGILTFGTSNRKASAPSYMTETPKASKQKAYILLSGNEAVDQMGLIIADNYTAEYEVNADLEKLLSDGNTLRTYMIYNNLNMAYVAINDVLAQEWIPVTVRIPATGEYSFSLHSASKVGELEGVYLIDYANGDRITNLIEENYMFVAEAGTISGRFAINAKVGEHKVPTDIDIVNVGGDLKSEAPFKFIYNDKVYIYHRGVIYDAMGKRVREINK